MVKVDLKIAMKDSSMKDLDRTLSYVNGSLSNAALVEVAQQLVGLTTNTYVGGERVDRMDISQPAPPPAGKQEPTLTVTPNGSDDEQIRSNGYTVTYDGDATLMLVCDSSGQAGLLGTLSGGSGTWTLMPQQGGATAMKFTAYVVAPSTDNYTAAIAQYSTNIPM